MSEEMDTTQETSAQEETTESVSTLVEETQEQLPTWMRAEGVPGVGDKPEWFKADKYKTVEDQAQAYIGLESKLGKFTGAPDEYAVNLSQELQDRGIEINSDDPIMEEALKFAKESNMNQEGFDNMINLYAMSKIADAEALEAFKAEQIKALGPSGQARISNINSWATKNLPGDLVEGLQGMATSAKAVETIEQLIALTRPGASQPEDSTTVSANTEEDVRKMQFEKDEHGNRRIQTDRAFRKRYEAMRDEVYGTEPKRTLIG